MRISGSVLCFIWEERGKYFDTSPTVHRGRGMAHMREGALQIWTGALSELDFRQRNVSRTSRDLAT